MRAMIVLLPLPLAPTSASDLCAGICKLKPSPHPRELPQKKHSAVRAHTVEDLFVGTRRILEVHVLQSDLALHRQRFKPRSPAEAAWIELRGGEVSIGRRSK